MPDPQTWHHGLIARWWEEFNDSFRPHEIEYYRPFAADGQPVLDAGCGSGRLLVPFAREGIDIDGCDVSADMIEACRRKADAAGVMPELAVAALHEVDMPRRYRTIIAVGVFGLGSDRDRDQAALRRLHDHLEPENRLVLDAETPYADPGHWKNWTETGRKSLPEAAETPTKRRTAADGSEYALSTRILGVDPLVQRVTMEIHARRWLDDQLAGEERHVLDATYYFPTELRMMLERAGFEIEAIHGDHQVRDPLPEDEFVVFVARRG